MKISLAGSLHLRIEDADSPDAHLLHTLKKAAEGLSHDRKKLAAAMAACFPTILPSRFQEAPEMANPIVQKTIDEVTKTRGVVQSATKLITNFHQILTDAVAAALANGATAEELQPVSDVVDALAADEKSLSDAVAANPTL